MRQDGGGGGVIHHVEMCARKPEAERMGITMSGFVLRSSLSLIVHGESGENIQLGNRDLDIGRRSDGESLGKAFTYRG